MCLDYAYLGNAVSLLELLIVYCTSYSAFKCQYIQCFVKPSRLFYPGKQDLF